MKVRNTFIIFIVSGFWHGANWTFIVWGFLNALFIMPSILLNTNRDHLETVAQGKILPTLKESCSMVLTFGLTVFAWIFFRAASVTQAWHIITKIASRSLLQHPEFDKDDTIKPTLLLVGFFMVIEWMGREQQYAIQRLVYSFPRSIRWAFYGVLTFIIYYFALSIDNQQFIYFQF
jgi:hypothetical protein